MSGHSENQPCPKCRASMTTYSDYKPHDYVSGECLECGFAYSTVEYKLSLKEVNRMRVDQHLPKLKRKEFRMNTLRNLVFVFLIMFAFLKCDVVWATTISDSQAINSILGEAEDQGLVGMTALGEAIRNRGSLNGVYGYKAIVIKNGNYYRKTKKGLRLLSKAIVKQAHQAWKASATSDYVHGADHWENVEAFGMPSWAYSMEKTFAYKDHAFFKS